MSAPPIIDRHKMQFHRQAPVKELVRAATTASITISTALNNGDTLDGVTLATGDRVLVKDQSTDSQNGIYVVGATPVRDYDLSTDDPGFGYFVIVIQGSANAGTVWRNTNTSAPTVGSTSITFTQFSGGVPAGAITSSGLTMSTARLLGRTTASTGAIEEITVGSGLSLSAGSITATGGGTGTVDTAKDGSTTVNTPDTIKITGSGGVAVSVSESPSGTAAFVVDGSGVTGSGGTDNWLLDIICPAGSHGNTNWTTYNHSTELHGTDVESSGAQNDEIYWDVGFSGGTWDMTLIHFQGSNRGIYTVSIDGSSIGTIDGYNAGATVDVQSVITGVSISGGKRRVKLKMATKNASSSNYYGTVNHIQFRRTA